jgi:hypothetical protein
MAINKKLIHFKTLEKFNTELANGNILDTSIVFIQDAQKIWTHGTLYDCDAAALREEIIKNEEVVAAALNDLQENKASKTYVDEAVANAGGGDENVQSDWNETNTSSDAYIKNKPTIPAAITESTVSGWGFTKNAGTITGVSANGTSIATSGVANIPAASTSAYGVTKLSSATNSTSTSLAATSSAVKAAYDLANSYKGTVTGVKINGTTKNPSSGVVDLGTVITAHQTLKTINGESIVGSGDITINSGGSSNVATINLSSTLSSSGGTFTTEEQAIIFDNTIGVIIFNNNSGNKTWVLHRDSTNPSNLPVDPRAVFTGTRRTSVTARSLVVLQVNRDGSYTFEEKNLMFKGDISSYPIVNASTLIGANGISNGLQLPTNTYCTLSHGSSILAITLQTPSDTTVVNEYLLEITLTGTPTISFPSSIKWVNGEAPTFESGNTYQISIVNNLAVCVKFQ